MSVIQTILDERIRRELIDLRQTLESDGKLLSLLKNVTFLLSLLRGEPPSTLP